MYTKLYEIKPGAKTIKGINNAIEKFSGNADFYESEKDMNNAIKQGFLELTNNKITVLYDGL